MNIHLEVSDHELYKLIQEEKNRQQNSIELIASENFTSRAVMDCLGSVLTNKYSEGLPGKRYYGGNQIIDQIEQLCIKRALKAYNLNPEIWGCNVQPYSGSVANLAVYLGLLNPHDRIMGLDLPSGGHLTHGFMNSKRRVSCTSVYYESIPYKVNDQGWIDYEDMEKIANIVYPKLIICGGSAYSRDFDYERFSRIAKKHSAYLMADIAHISGLVATGEMKSPFDHCDIVTTTTHKTMRGPRAGIIFYRKELERKINEAVFPGLQGGPHENQIAGIATQLLELTTPEFHDYIKKVKYNCSLMTKILQEKYGFTIVTGGSDNHLFLIDLRNKKLSGTKAEKILEYVNISVNKNMLFSDISALSNGIRIGTSAITTRGFGDKEIEFLCSVLNRVINIGIEIGTGISSKEFSDYLENSNNQELIEIKKDINNVMSKMQFYDF